MENFMFYLQQGFFHVLDWKAYDHMLFLAALTVIYTFSDWKRILLLVTLFTLGHTLTLLLSAYNIISINTVYVEFLIPATIFVTALSNMFTAGKSSKKNKSGINLFFAFFFGLIHGLGFAGYFRMIVAVNEDKLAPLLEFALGIEGAQIVIVILILIAAFAFQTVFGFSKRDWVLVISSLIMGIVIPMLIKNKFW
ncbi:MAG: HupE/UreJ family protein [Flavobacteriaceae bacterium]|nr:HupE/UreJ family protein [Flavobacteriaceae bacterium]